MAPEDRAMANMGSSGNADLDAAAMQLRTQLQEILLQNADVVGACLARTVAGLLQQFIDKSRNGREAPTNFKEAISTSLMRRLQTSSMQMAKEAALGFRGAALAAIQGRYDEAEAMMTLATAAEAKSREKSDWDSRPAATEAREPPVMDAGPQIQEVLSAPAFQEPESAPSASPQTIPQPQVVCPKGHKLSFAGVNAEDWICDVSQADSTRVCVSGLCLFGNSAAQSLESYRCELCNFDICKPCYEAQLSELLAKASPGGRNSELGSYQEAMRAIQAIQELKKSQPEVGQPAGRRNLSEPPGGRSWSDTREGTLNGGAAGPPEPPKPGNSGRGALSRHEELGQHLQSNLQHIQAIQAQIAQQRAQRGVAQ